MDRVVIDLVQALRASRLRPSPAECLDALAALRAVGLGERGVVRDALRATLVKRAEDHATFDRLFDAFFGLHGREAPAPAPRGVHRHDHAQDGTPPARVELGEDLAGEAVEADHHGHGHGHEPGSGTELRRFLPEERLRPSQDIHGEAERLRLSLFAQELVLNRAPGTLQQVLQRITHQLRVRRARNIFTPGELVSTAGQEEVALDVSAGELAELMDHLHELEVDDRLLAELAAQAEGIIAGLPDLIRAMTERQRALAGAPGDDRVLQRRSLRRLVDVSATEQREMEAAIRRLAREIHGAQARRMRRDRTGRISVAHTVRASLRYEGVPFEPVLRRRREGKPRLVVLCDVSLSTRNLARFWLHLVSQLQRLFSRVRTYVFVADVAEVTQLLQEQTLQRAVERVFGGDLIDVDVNSDFGRAAERFRLEHLDAITRRTSVVVLGDGRNHGTPPNVEALREIAARARRLIWMTPEPRWGWSLGGCDLPLYEQVCDRVEVVRTVDHLARVAEGLVADRGRPRPALAAGAA